MATRKKKSLEQNVKENFPQYSYLLESPEIFGQDMIAVFRKAIKNEWTADRLAGAISNTNYWKTTVGAAKRFDAATPADQETLMEDVRTELQSVSDFSGLSDSDEIGRAHV
jgi:hypothetical protein